MSFKSTRQLHVEGLEPRTLLAGDGIAPGLIDAIDLDPPLIQETAQPVAADKADLPGDSNGDGWFDQSDLIAVLQSGKYRTKEPATWAEGDWNRDKMFDEADFIFALKGGNYEKREDTWPDLISLPVGFEPKSIELGKGHEFFVGAYSWSSLLGPAVEITHPVSPQAGAVYKGDLSSGEGEILVSPTGRPILGLSYDARTDYLYASVGDPATLGEAPENQGVAIYNGTTGELIREVPIGDGPFLSNVLVTKSAVFATTTNEAVIFKMPLGKGGKLTSTPAFERIELTGFEPANGFYAWGLEEGFKGKNLLVLNGLNGSGVLYRVDIATGASTPIEIKGAQQLFDQGDGLYLSGRTLYIASTFDPNGIAVVQLSGDLTEGTFVKSIPSDDFRTPHSIIGFGDSIYAVNSNVLFDPTMAAEDVIFGEPGTIQSAVVRVDK